MRCPWTTALAVVAFAFLAGAAKINTPRVLLPWLGPGMRVNFTFEITEGGCYSWSLSREDLVSLEPLYEDSWGHCSRAARVTPLAACSPPGSVIILAEDVTTGEIIRGDVDVDRISSLRIVSTTWKLLLEEAPEAFEVEAFDDPGNKFSSLEGLEFTWRVEISEDKKHEEPVVKLVWWRDTDYEAPRGIAEMESRGIRSYSALLYGQTMGEARVAACLNATCADVALRVVASVVLTPATAVIAPGDAIRYRIVRARAGRLTVEDVADTLYNLIVPNDGVAFLEDSNSLVGGRTEGKTSLSLVSGSTEMAAATLSVANPHSIRVHLRPPGLLVRGEKFIVHAIVMDERGRALTAGERMLVRLSVHGTAEVNLVHSTENGTLTDAVPYATGSFKIVAQLYSVAGKTLSQRVEGSVEAMVVEPLEVVPPEVFIAWTDKPIEVQLRHRGGGDGPVSWSAEQASGELTVDPAGTVHARSVGSATVGVQLKEHPHIRALAQVWVAEAEYVRAASSGHARVGRTHALHVALTGAHPTTGELFTFHKCDCNSFAVALLEGPEPQNVTAATWIEPLEGACCVLTMAWGERGACAVHVSRGRAGDTARVLVHAAPQLVWPPAAAMLLGASVPVLAAGEALAAHAADPGVADVRPRGPPAPHAHPHLQLFTLTCQRKGDTTLELQSRSAQAEEAAAEAEAEGGGAAAVACAPSVARVRLAARGAANCSAAPPRDAATARSGAWVWVRAGGEAWVSTSLLDTAGRELLDERGHRVSWDTNPAHRSLEFAATDRLLMEADPEYEPVPVPLSYYQIIRAGQAAVGWSGVIRATAGDASATIQARVVAPLVVTPQQVSAAWERGKVSVAALVSGGSGRYSVETQKEVAASVEDGRLAAAWPAPGRYRLAVTDDCLVGEVVNVEVRVEEVTSVEVSAPRAVCVEACVPLAAVARGGGGRALAAAAAPVWRVTGGAELREQRLCGLREGLAVVRASVAGVWSAELEVVVFPPLRVRPERVRVPPGARAQLSHVGGPPPHLAAFVYAAASSASASADDTIHVTAGGLLSGVRAGAARVRLAARDADGTEMAHAYADVEVVSVRGVRAVAATSSLLVGEETPLWLEAEPALDVAALAALQPPPRVAWSLRDPAAATLTAPLRPIQSADKSTAEGLSVRLIPLRSGPIIVDVRVRNFAQEGESRSWDTTVQVVGGQELTATVDGSADEVRSGGVAVAVGGTVRLRAPRATWSALPADAPAFEIAPSGELRALRVGFGVALARYRDDANHFERETAVHVEVAAPHYITVQLGAAEAEAEAEGEEDTTLRVEARSPLGRRLLAHNLTLAADAARHHNLAFVTRRLPHGRGSELSVSGLESGGGAFVSVEARDGGGGGGGGGATLRDQAWLERAADGERVRARAGDAVCAPGGGWRAPAAAGLWLGERGGVTLLVLGARAAVSARHHLRADRPPRTLTVLQAPLTKLEFLAGEWSAALVPLALNAHCTHEQRLALADLQPQLPFLCRVAAPHAAAAAFDAFTGKIGCSVSSETGVTRAEEVEVCAEWGALRACTTLLLLPPVRLAPDRLSLAGAPTELTVTGHPAALRSLTVTASPGEHRSVSSETAVTHAEEVEVCAEWGALRACTALILLPPVRLAPDRLSLAGAPTELTVTGHPAALRSLTVIASPGEHRSVSPETTVTRAEEVEVCAEWGALRACTALFLLLLVRLAPNRLSLAGAPTELTVTGHPAALRSLTVIASPGDHRSVSPETTVTRAEEVEVCAEWGALRACTALFLLLLVRLAPNRLSLAGAPTELTVTGHPAALCSLTVTASPGLTVTTRRRSDTELEVVVSSADAECGAGWLWVQSARTAQALRVPVLRECDATCGSLLGTAFALLRPHLAPLALAALAAAAAYYYLQVWSPRRLAAPAPVAAATALPLSPAPRTWHRSPYAVPKPPPPPSPSPPAPVYGDASLLPDSSFSPNSTRAHSRFL